MTDFETVGAAEAAPLALPSRAKQDPALPSPGMPSHALPYRDDAASYHRKLSRLLDRMGGTYLLSDILIAIAEGRMQSFVEGNSWAITKVADFPRARQLELVAYVGDLADVDALHAKILAYADEVNAGLLSTYGRLGWLREGSFRRFGWRLKSTNHLYVKEL
jgi:hypothetical protein